MHLIFYLHLSEPQLQICISSFVSLHIQHKQFLNLSSFPVVYGRVSRCVYLLTDSFSSPGILTKHSHQRCGGIYLREHQTLTAEFPVL